MKRTLILLFLFFAITQSFSQDLPENPEPGKCYVRCTTPDVYVNEEIKVLVKPSHKILKTIPAKFEKITERVIVKEAEKKLKVIPAKWGKESVDYTKKENAYYFTATPASFKDDYETIEIKPKYAQWEIGGSNPDCESSNPDDCKYWCYKGYPAEFEIIPVKKLINNATVNRKPLKGQKSNYTKRVIIEQAKVIEEIKPAEYATITKTIKVENAKTIEEIIPDEYKTITREVLKKKGGLTSWKEVDCSLVEYQVLPINWDLNSANLTNKAKDIIDNKLLPILANNPTAKLEIASHTDSRGTYESNQTLSENRAQAVVKYLQIRGINPSLLVANGYGEVRLKNRCSDGVSCTEREHAINRRTEFRLINN
ncbi:MAG: OmpA family protein [Flavobacteriales bacterium]